MIVLSLSSHEYTRSSNGLISFDRVYKTIKIIFRRDKVRSRVSTGFDYPRNRRTAQLCGSMYGVHCWQIVLDFLYRPKIFGSCSMHQNPNTPVDEVMTSIGGGSGSLRFDRRTDTRISRRKLQGSRFTDFEIGTFVQTVRTNTLKVQDKNRK